MAVFLRVAIGCRLDVCFGVFFFFLFWVSGLLPVLLLGRRWPGGSGGWDSSLVLLLLLLQRADVIVSRNVGTLAPEEYVTLTWLDLA